MIAAAWNTFVELAPWLLLGAAAGGLLEVLLPPGFLRRHLAGRGGVARAVLLGVPLPLCSCGVVPTGLGLKKQGASNGATLGFLVSTPQTGVDSVLATAALLGWPLALFKVATAAVTGLAAGWIADSATPPDDPPTQLPVLEEAPATPAWRRGIATADELLRSIWLWVVLGVVISAGITVLLPSGSMQSLAVYQGLPGMLAALAISLPLYVCATASAPIAASLVAGGLPAGAAIVFLMAGPATNAATLGAVYRTLGARMLAIYLSTILVGSIAGGLLFGWLVGSVTGEAAHAGHSHTADAPWLGVASAWVLVVMFLRYAGERIAAWRGKSNASGCCDGH